VAPLHAAGKVLSEVSRHLFVDVFGVYKAAGAFVFTDEIVEQMWDFFVLPGQILAFKVPAVDERRRLLHHVSHGV